MIWSELPHLVMLIAAGLSVDASGSGGDSLDGAQIYSRAVTALGRSERPEFLSYRLDLVDTHGSRQRRYAYAVQERTSDHQGRLEGLRPDGSRSGDVQVSQMQVPPDLFLRAVSTDQKPSTDGTPAPRTVASVVVSNYDIVLDGREDLVGCTQAAKLTMTPKSDPERYTLRTLWIDTTTFRICKAGVFRHVRIISPTTAIVNVDLAQNGYVSHWDLTATGKLLVGSYTASIEGSYTDIETSLPLASSLFK